MNAPERIKPLTQKSLTRRVPFLPQSHFLQKKQKQRPSKLNFPLRVHAV